MHCIPPPRDILVRLSQNPSTPSAAPVEMRVLHAEVEGVRTTRTESSDIADQMIFLSLFTLAFFGSSIFVK